MIDLSEKAKDCRVAWLVKAENNIYICRSGNGIKYLGNKYKKIDTAPAMISKELADELIDSVIYLGDFSKNKQLKLI